MIYLYLLPIWFWLGGAACMFAFLRTGGERAFEMRLATPLAIIWPWTLWVQGRAHGR